MTTNWPFGANHALGGGDPANDMNKAEEALNELHAHEVGTGVRDISSLLINGWAATGDLLIVRQSSRVDLFGYSLRAGAKTDDVFLKGIPGFRMIARLQFDNGMYDGGVRREVLCDGATFMALGAVGDDIYLKMSWFTLDPWPTELPGDPVVP